MPGIVMTEDAAIPHYSTEVRFCEFFIFENKSIIFDMWRFFTSTFLPFVCGSEQIMWFNLNCQF